MLLQDEFPDLGDPAVEAEVAHILNLPTSFPHSIDMTGVCSVDDHVENYIGDVRNVWSWQAEHVLETQDLQGICPGQPNCDAGRLSWPG